MHLAFGGGRNGGSNTRKRMFDVERGWYDGGGLPRDWVAIVTRLFRRFDNDSFDVSTSVLPDALCTLNKSQPTGRRCHLTIAHDENSGSLRFLSLLWL